MAPHIFADDKPAKERKETYRYHVAELPTLDAAKADAEYVRRHVDAERWEIVAEYGRSGSEPAWDQAAHWRESPHVPKEGAA